MDFYQAKTELGFIPATDKDKEKISKVSIGEVVKCSTIDQRNYKLLQKYWVLMNFGYEHLPEKYDGYWAIVDDFEEEVLKAIGWKRISKDFRGNDVVMAKSISFKSLPEEHIFQEIYNRALTLISRFIDTSEDELMNELISFM